MYDTPDLKRRVSILEHKQQVIADDLRALANNRGDTKTARLMLLDMADRFAPPLFSVRFRTGPDEYCVGTIYRDDGPGEAKILAGFLEDDPVMSRESYRRLLVKDGEFESSSKPLGDELLKALGFFDGLVI